MEAGIHNTVFRFKPAAVATAPLIQNVNRAAAKPNRMLNGRKHHIRRGFDGTLPPPLLLLPPPLLLPLPPPALARFVIKSYTRKTPGLVETGRGEAVSGCGGGTKIATMMAEVKQAMV